MTGDKAVELINEWLNLAKEIGDMNLNRMEYDEESMLMALQMVSCWAQEESVESESENVVKGE